jgi:hypothetical protein
MASGPDVTMWATAISTHSGNGRKIIYRFAKDFSPAFERARQPIRIIIVWKYQSEFGQPGAEEIQRMYLLEDALGSAFDEGRFATLTLVSTGEDLREWTYYARSEDEFAARFNYAIAGMPDWPIEIHTAHDPQWETYEEFKAGVVAGL